MYLPTTALFLAIARLVATAPPAQLFTRDAPLISLYNDTDWKGQSWSPPVNDGACQNFPPGIDKHMRSLKIAKGAGCTMYNVLNCPDTTHYDDRKSKYDFEWIGGPVKMDSLTAFIGTGKQDYWRSMLCYHTKD
jgi:hypothetical protein